MRFANTEQRYGWLSISLHWLTALAVFILFGVGLWMTDMDYSDPWYRTAPHLHKSFGVLLVGLVIMRLAWRWYSPPPAPLAQHRPWEKRLAKSVHGLLYLIMLLMFPAGYLITTAKGQGLEVFNWFEIPSLINGIDNLEDLAAQVHEILAYTLIALVILHALGAVKHHLVDKDSTLKRIFGRG